MIYQLGQVSNRDTQVLYFYRILRHSGTNLGEIYRYDNPDVFILDKAQEVRLEDETWYEYHLKVNEIPNRIPYLEFLSEDEVELKHIEDIAEVEVRADELVLRGHTDELTDKTSVAVYWVPSLAYIDELQKKIEDIIGDLRKRAKKDAEAINKISVNSDYVINLEGVVPNLVNIGKDEEGLIYDDSHYMLSGSVSEQTIVNPSQSLVSSLLKSHTGTLTIVDIQRESKVYQGFYGGVIRLSGSFKILVLRDITSIVYLNGITADKLIIENCPAVIFRQSIDLAGSSTKVIRLELRNSYVTVNQPIEIRNVWCYRMSTLVLMLGKIHTIGCIEAGSSLIYDTPSENCKIEDIRPSKMQGLFYASNPPAEMPYLDEIFFAQKPIAFQRGQVEDPLPISKAEVSIYLKHSGTPGPGPGPSPSGKIYSPFTDWYWSGDSRTVQLIAATGTDGKGYGGQALDKLIQVQSEIESEGVNHNIILWWGVNGLGSGASAYADVYKSIANNVGNNAKVFVGTVGFCPNGNGSGKCDGGAGQDLGPFNQEIKQFNEDLKAALSGVSNIVILDVNEYIHQLEDDKGAAWLTQDNLHYLPEASKAIYAWVCDQITNVEGVDVDTRYTPFTEYVSVDISDAYMGSLPTLSNIDQNVGLGIMYGISLREYGNNPVGWLYARMFRTYLMLGTYKRFSSNLTEEGRALLHPETGAWSFGTFYNESGLLDTVRTTGTQEGLENFYYMIKYGGVMTGYTADMDDYDKMRIIAGGAPTGNNSETGCPQDGQFHENYFASGIVDARWIYDSPSSWIPYGTGRMTYYSDRSTTSGGTINPNI